MAQSTATIYINGKEVDNTLKGLTAEAARLNAELRRATLGTEDFAQKAERFRKVETIIVDQKNALREYANAFKAVTPVVEGSINQLKTKHSELLKELENLKRGTAEYNAKLKEVGASAQEIEKVDAEIAKVSKTTDDATKSLQPMHGSLLQIAGVAAAAFAAQKVLEFGMAGIKAASDFEQAQIAFETMIGSSEKAGLLIQKIVELAAKTPFEQSELIDYSKRLLAMGIETEKIIPTMESLGNIAAGVGKEKLPQLVLAFGQVATKTKLAGGELKQFTEAGVPLIAALAAQFKVSEAEIFKMSETGKIGFKDVEKAIFAMSQEGGKFFNLMEKQSKTVDGLFSTLKDNIQIFSKNVFSSVANGLKPVLGFAIDFFDKFNKGFDSLTPRMDSMLKATEKERTELSVLVENVTKYEIGSQKRKAIIDQIVAIQPKFLAGLDKEKVTNEQLRDRLQEVNQQYLAKILAINAGKEVEASLTRQKNIVDKQAIAQLSYVDAIVKTRQVLNDSKSSATELAAKLRATFQNGSFYSKIFDGEAGQARDLLRVIESKRIASESYTEALGRESKVTNTAKLKQQQLLEELKKSFPQLAAQFDAIAAAAEKTDKVLDKGKPKVEGGVVDDKAKKELEKEQDKLLKLKEMLVQYQNDIDQMNATRDQSEAIKIKEKYDKQIEIAKELLLSKDPENRKEATRILKELQNKTNLEILAMLNKHNRELEEKIRKHEDEITATKLGEQEKRLNAIRESYKKELDAAKELEESGIPEIVAKGAAARIRLEKAMNAELQAETNKFNAEKVKKIAEDQAKEYADTEKFKQDMLKLNQDYEAILRDIEKPVIAIKPGSKEELEKTKADIKAKAEIDIQELQIKVDKEKAILGDDVEKKAKLEQALADKKKAIRIKADVDALKAEREFVNKSIAHYQDLANAIGNAFSALGDIIGNETAEAAALQKVAALAKIAVDTAQAISGVVAAAASTSITPIDLAIKVATGVAVVLANIATAKKILNDAPSVKQKKDGGYHVRGEDDGRVYDAQYIGSPRTGMLPSSPSLVLASEAGPEYFVSNAALTRPDVAWHVRMIDNIVSSGGVKQRKEGGYGGSSDAVEVKQVTSDTQLVAVLSELIRVLENGIDAKVSIGYAIVKEITEAQKRIQTIKG